MIVKKIINLDVLFFMFAAYLITRGVLNREDSFLTAETGTGYMLGIIGGSMMLLLMLYPLRKHARFMRSMGPIKYWFRTHMLFGVAGPVLILFHSNFSLGSTNSNIALICMLVVAGSGLFGRFFYSRIHEGLYGRKIQLAELQNGLQSIKDTISEEQMVDIDLEKIRQNMLRIRSLPIMLLRLPYIYLKLFMLQRKMIKKLLVKTQASDSEKLKKMLVNTVSR